MIALLLLYMSLQDVLLYSYIRARTGSSEIVSICMNANRQLQHCSLCDEQPSLRAAPVAVFQLQAPRLRVLLRRA